MSVPFSPITRWHGTITVIGLRPTAAPTARDASGLPLHRGAPLASTQEALLALPGIGEWTTQLLALRVLGWPDAFPATDIGLLKALGLAQARDAPQAIAMAESWRPWRSYAVIALWRALESNDTSSPGSAPKAIPPKNRNAAPKPPTTARRKAIAKES